MVTKLTRVIISCCRFRLVIRERFSPELEKKTDAPARKVCGVTGQGEGCDPVYPEEDKTK